MVLHARRQSNVSTPRRKGTAGGDRALRRTIAAEAPGWDWQGTLPSWRARESAAWMARARFDAEAAFRDYLDWVERHGDPD
jgi:hypothetical protein